MVRFTVLSAVLCPAFLLLLPSLSTFSLVKSEEASLPGAAAVSLAEGVGGEEGGGRTSGGSSPADSADSADLTSVSSMSASESEPDTASSTASMEDASPSTPGGGGGEDAAAGGGGGAEDEGLEGIKMVHREHWSVIKAVQQKTFNWQWFYFPPKESCEAMTINLKKTTNLLRLVVLDVLKAALDSLAKSPRHEKDSHLVTFICAAGVTYVDSYRTMKLAYQTATNEHDETGVSTPIGQWYAMTFKKEAKKIGRKNKRLQSLYNECAIAATHANSILTAKDYSSPESQIVSLPAAYGNSIDAAVDPFGDFSNKQTSSIMAKCMAEKTEPRKKAWIIIHYAMIQTWVVLDRLVECTTNSQKADAPKSPDEKLGLFMARQVLLDHTHAQRFFQFFQTVEQFNPFAEKLGFFKNKAEATKAGQCALPGVAGAEFPGPGSQIVTSQLYRDFHTYFE